MRSKMAMEMHPSPHQLTDAAPAMKKPFVSPYSKETTCPLTMCYTHTWSLHIRALLFREVDGSS